MRPIQHTWMRLTLGLLLLAGVRPGPGAAPVQAASRPVAPAALAGVQAELATIKTGLERLSANASKAIDCNAKRHSV